MNALLTEGTCNLHEINLDPIGALKKGYDKVYKKYSINVKFIFKPFI